MNRQFLRSFESLNGNKEFDTFRKIKNNEVVPVIITDEQKNYIRKYLLNSECITNVRGNELTVSTNNSDYILSFYDQFITLLEKINCHNMLKMQTNKRYIRYN